MPKRNNVWTYKKRKRTKKYKNTTNPIPDRIDDEMNMESEASSTSLSLTPPQLHSDEQREVKNTVEQQFIKNEPTMVPNHDQMKSLGSTALMPAFGMLEVQKVITSSPIKVKQEPSDGTVPTEKNPSQIKMEIEDNDCEIIAALKPIKRITETIVIDPGEDVVIIGECIIEKEPEVTADTTSKLSVDDLLLLASSDSDSESVPVKKESSENLCDTAPSSPNVDIYDNSLEEVAFLQILKLCKEDNTILSNKYPYSSLGLPNSNIPPLTVRAEDSNETMHFEYSTELFTYMDFYLQTGNNKKYYTETEKLLDMLNGAVEDFKHHNKSTDDILSNFTSVMNIVIEKKQSCQPNPTVSNVAEPRCWQPMTNSEIKMENAQNELNFTIVNEDNKLLQKRNRTLSTETEKTASQPVLPNIKNSEMEEYLPKKKCRTEYEIPVLQIVPCINNALVHGMPTNICQQNALINRLPYHTKIPHHQLQKELNFSTVNEVLQKRNRTLSTESEEKPLLPNIKSSEIKEYFPEKRCTEFSKYENPITQTTVSCIENALVNCMPTNAENLANVPHYELNVNSLKGVEQCLSANENSRYYVDSENNMLQIASHSNCGNQITLNSLDPRKSTYKTLLTKSIPVASSPTPNFSAVKHTSESEPVTQKYGHEVVDFINQTICDLKKTQSKPQKDCDIPGKMSRTKQNAHNSERPKKIDLREYLKRKQSDSKERDPHLKVPTAIYNFPSRNQMRAFPGIENLQPQMDDLSVQNMELDSSDILPSSIITSFPEHLQIPNVSCTEIPKDSKLRNSRFSPLMYNNASATFQSGIGCDNISREKCNSSIGNDHVSKAKKLLSAPYLNQRSVSLVPKSLKEDVGQNFIGSSSVYLIIIEWGVDWFSEYEAVNEPIDSPPPILPDKTELSQVKNTYRNSKEYYNTYLKLLLMESWHKIYNAWKDLKVSYKEYIGKIQDYEPKIEFNKYIIEYFVRAEDCELMPKESDIVLLRFTTLKNDFITMLGYVTRVMSRSFQSIYDQYNEAFIVLECPGTNILKYKVTIYTVFKSDDINTREKVFINKLVSIRKMLQQNDALNNISKSKLSKTVFAPIMSTCKVNFSIPSPSAIPSVMDQVCGLVLNPEPMLGLISTPLSCSERMAAVSCLIDKLKIIKSYSKIILCSKSETMLSRIANELRKYKPVLIGKERHPELQKYSLKKLVEKNMRNVINHELGGEEERTVRSRVLMNSNVLLVLLLGTHEPISSLAHELDVSCVILDEAHSCTEPESIVPLTYGIQKFILLGNPVFRCEGLSLTTVSYDFNRSLFNRASL